VRNPDSLVELLTSRSKPHLRQVESLDLAAQDAYLDRTGRDLKQDNPVLRAELEAMSQITDERPVEEFLDRLPRLSAWSKKERTRRRPGKPL
jgi:hypothetical protein